MPVQTTKGNLYFGDGCKVSIKASGDGSFTDLGVIESAVENTIEFDEVQIETANAGKTQKQINNMRVAGSFTLYSIDQAGIEKLSGGSMTLTTTTATPTTTVDDQTISAGWTDNTLINLDLIDGGVSLVADSATEPTFTSVTASSSGALIAGDDYHIVSDTNSPSGYSIYFDVAGTNTVATSESIVIDYNSVTPRASTKITMGSSSQVLNQYAFKFTHTDGSSKIRELELYAVDTNSGGFNVSFKGANEDALESLPISYTANLDINRTDGDQLLGWTIEDGAQ